MTVSVAIARLWAAAALAAGTALILTLILDPAMRFTARFGFMLGAGLLPMAVLPLTGRPLRRIRLRHWGAAIAALGAALVLLGAASVTALAEEARLVVAPGERVAIGPWLVEMAAVDPVAGAGFTALEARLRVTRGTGVTLLRPQLRSMISPAVETAAPGTVTAWTGQLTAKLGLPRGDGWQLLLSWAPLVTLVWLGGGLIAIGAMVALAGLGWRIAGVAVGVMLLGTAGYAFAPRMGSVPPTTVRAPMPSLVTPRNAFLGQFNGSSHWLIISDSYAARGQTRDAAGILQSATRQHPRDYALWLGLGNALTAHAGRLTPAAQLAFDRSAMLVPASPAPAYFLGLAKQRSGDRAGALADWQRILAEAPANAGWRPFVEDSVAMAGTTRSTR